jgi:transposase
MATKKKATSGTSSENIALYRMALELWLAGTMNMSRIAEIVGVSHMTIHNWKVKNDWEKLRSAQLRPTQQRIAYLERQMDALEDSTQGADGKVELWKNADVDLYTKLVAARKAMASTSIGQVVQMVHDISDYALRNMPEASAEIAKCLDGYLTEYTAIINKEK